MLELEDKQIHYEMSNDAFHLVYFDEEPIDDCQEEVDKIMSEFPNGFLIDTYEFIGDTGIVQVVLQQYIESAFSPHWIVEEFNGWSVQCAREGNTMHHRFVHDKKGPQEVRSFGIYRTAAGTEYYGTLKGNGYAYPVNARNRKFV